jgi:hypothetical protein
MSYDPGLIPLVIGITGHRNPAADQIESIEAAVAQALRMLDRLSPHTPIMLLTPLAAGCDRIAARVALGFRRAHSADSVRVVGVFPLALDDYRRDFAGNEADEAEFEALLGRLDSWFELPRWEGAELDASGFVTRPDHRDLHYRRLGLFMALQSQVVIAMWDGTRNRKVGGTAEVVDFCLGARPEGLAGGIPFRQRPMLLAPPDATSVLCVPTRREGGEVAAEAVQLAGRGLDGQACAALRDLDFLNVELARTKPPGWVPDMAKVAPPTVVAEPWGALRDRFLRLDALASAKKKEHILSAWLVPALAALAVSAFQYFSSYAGNDPGRAWFALALYVGLLLAAVGAWWYLVRRRRIEWVFVHARALAEAMRIQFAWIGCDIAEVAPDLYFARRSSEVAFLRAQLRAAVLDGLVVSCRGGLARGVQVGSLWVDEQVTYFRRDGASMKHRERNARRQRHAKLLLRWTVLISSAALLGAAVAEALGARGLVQDWSGLGCFVVGVALAVAVAFDHGRNVMLDEEDLDAADRMKVVFGRAQELLARDPSQAAEIIRAIGKEALDEHADWFARHRDRLRLPEAG